MHQGLSILLLVCLLHVLITFSGQWYRFEDGCSDEDELRLFDSDNDGTGVLEPKSSRRIDENQRGVANI